MLAAGYAILICRGGDFGPPGGMSWPSFLQTFPNIGHEVASRIRQFFGPLFMPTVWDALQRAPSGHPLILVVIDDLTATGLGNLYLDKVFQGIGNYLKPLAPNQQRQFVRQLARYDGYWNELQGLDDSTFLQVVRLSKSWTGEDGEKLSEVVRNRLTKTPSEAWVAAIEQANSIYELVSEFSSDLPSRASKGEPYGALVSQVQNVVKTHDRQLMKRWFFMCGLLTDQAEQKAINALAEQIAGGGYVADLLALLKESNATLLKATALKPDILIRTIIVPLLDARPGRKWVESHIAQLEPRVRKASRDAVAGLRSEIDRLARSASKWKQQDAARLRSAFGLT
jgi:hypothetical protein